MIINEAIKKMERIARGHRKNSELLIEGEGKDGNIRLAEEYQQIADWLKKYNKLSNAFYKIKDTLETNRTFYQEIGDVKETAYLEILKIFDEYTKNVEYEEKEHYFPAIIGCPVEMFVNGTWIKGKIIDGYRFNDGIVTIETADGKQYWCGQDRTDLYRRI